MAKARRPSLARAEKILGEPARAWEARCFEIATKFVKKGLVDGVAVYGHWLGAVHPQSRFARGLPFVQHGWVLLSNPRGLICDPTRWCFEGKAPYIFWGKNHGEYDEGGNQWRSVLIGSPPRFGTNPKTVEIPVSVMDSAAWSFVEKLLDIDYTGVDAQPPGRLSMAQLTWLANTPPAVLGKHAGSIFDALAKLGLVAFIPIDNLRMVERMRGHQ